MPIMRIILEEPAWPELDIDDPRVIVAMDTDASLDVTGLQAGMASGKPSVVLRVNLPDGRIILTETSLALFLTAADALKTRFGDPRT